MLATRFAHVARRGPFCRKNVTGERTLALKSESLGEIHHPEKSGKVISDSGNGRCRSLGVWEKVQVIGGK